MHRFFLLPSQINNLEVSIPLDISHQIARVLRLKVKDRILVLDNSGKQYLAELTTVDPLNCRAAVIEVITPAASEAGSVLLFISLTQRDKFEWILQKATEIGTAGFYPMITSRSLVQTAQPWQKKETRWTQIIREAAEQSHRTRLPALHSPIQFQEALLLAQSEADLALIPWEEEKERSLKAVLREKLPWKNPFSIAIFIGPEGGFTQTEMDTAKGAGIIPVTLGKRILRMETAAVVAASLVLYELGEIG